MKKTIMLNAKLEIDSKYEIFINSVTYEDIKEEIV